MTTAMPPSNAVLADFGIPAANHGDLRNLPGGRGLSWRAADTVLRPSAGDGETLWKANVLAHLPHLGIPHAAPDPVGIRSVDDRRLGGLGVAARSHG
jgi:hypothetical protein